MIGQLDAAKLVASGDRSDQVEGDVIEVVKNRGEQDNVYLAIEPSADSQAIYWGQRAFDREKAPVLIIDTLPK